MSSRRSLLIGLVAAGLLAAACTATTGVSDEGSSAIEGPLTSIENGPTTTLPTVEIDGSTPLAEPTVDGLPSIADPDPEIVIGTLDNGLRYFVRANDNPGRSVEMRLVIDAGSALETDDQPGGAHFLEHMLFNGTERFPKNELIAVLRSFGAAFGADINAYTSYDETVYQLTMPTDDASVVDTGLDVLDEWLGAALIAPDDVEAERGIVLDEWRTSAASSRGRIFDAIEAMLLAGSVYEGRDPIGTDEAISATVAEPLRRFYDDWYRPDNAAVIVVGDIDPSRIEQGIIDRFSDAGSRGSNPPRQVLTVEVPDEPEATVVPDPDVAEGFAFVNLPLPVDTGAAPEAVIQRAILDDLAFDIIATRLSNAARRGETPFDDASVDSSSIVRALDAPEILVDADGADMQASVQAVLDEYERVRRFGFTPDEVERAVAARLSAEDSLYAARGSRQDASYAEEYVRHVLEDEPIPTADDGHALVSAILDAATPETVAWAFVTRLEASAPHMLVVVPDDEAGEVPDAAVFVEMADSMAERELEPVVEEVDTLTALMAAPAPVEEVAEERLSDGSVVSFVRPLVLTFGNGVRVALNRTEIVEGSVAMDARSVGGLEAVADQDVPDAEALGNVLGESGFASVDSVTLDGFLADKDVAVDLFVDPFVEGMQGFAADSDLEVLFQLIHLYVTEPAVDPFALDRYLDDAVPFAADPSIDQGTAEFTALLDARYDDPRFLLPTVESLDTVEAEGIERVHADRFGDASDWVFAFSGDFDLDTGIDLARRYLGTLPATGRVETSDFVEPPPPSGVVVAQVDGGTGDSANVSFLFTAPASADRRDDVASRLVAEIVTARLTTAIREELGESYSPFAVSQLTGGATPNAETYLSLSTGRELVDSVSTAVLGQLDDLRSVGPSEQEFAAAAETVFRDLNLYTNPGINDEVLNVLVDPAGNPSFDDYLDQLFLVDGFDRAEVQRYLADWLPASDYIAVEVRPR